MSQWRIAGFGVLASALLYVAATSGPKSTQATSPKPPVSKPQPKPARPREAAPAESRITLGGPTGPDGKTEVACDLPVSERLKNTGGMGRGGPGTGAGLCVFTSMEHAGRWQNVADLRGLQAKMTHEEGGGYPEKVDRMLKKYAPGIGYVQYEGNDPSLLATAIRSGRMPGVTYNGHDPHYGGTISHMVNLVAYDEQAGLACVLDNNFIGANELVWLDIPSFLERWRGGHMGWCVIFTKGPPPPVPHNGGKP